jgi:two-component system, NarL family, nitrate/nitrite response regulator NarL
MSSGRHDYRVVLVDDHVLFAESLELALTVQGYDVRRLEVTEDSPSLATVATRTLRLQPRCVMLDLDLGHLGDASDLVGPLARAGVNVVVVTASTDRSLWGACVRQGARKVVSKSAPLNHILGVVRRLHERRQVMTVAEREELLDCWQRQTSRHAAARARFALLSEREREVLGALMAGQNVRAIAEAGFVSEGTVRTQVKSILAKLELKSQLAAVGLAHEISWEPPPARTGSPRSVSR